MLADFWLENDLVGDKIVVHEITVSQNLEFWSEQFIFVGIGGEEGIKFFLDEAEKCVLQDLNFFFEVFFIWILDDWEHLIE